MADDDAMAEMLFDDVFNSVDIATILFEGAMKDGFAKGTYVVADSCPVITVDVPDESNWPKVITVDYGDGCTIDEIARKGKIIITITGPRRIVGSSRTVTFNDYLFNDIGIEGTYTISNEGANSNDNPVVSSTLTAGKITFPEGETIERSFSRDREWIAGHNTPWYIWDDEWLVTGSANGKNINDVNYANTIIVPLHRKRVCRFFVSGMILMEVDGREAVELDYGDGECDAKAVLRRGDQEKEINLRIKPRKFPIR